MHIPFRRYGERLQRVQRLWRLRRLRAEGLQRIERVLFGKAQRAAAWKERLWPLRQCGGIRDAGKARVRRAFLGGKGCIAPVQRRFFQAALPQELAESFAGLPL